MSDLFKIPLHGSGKPPLPYSEGTYVVSKSQPQLGVGVVVQDKGGRYSINWSDFTSTPVPVDERDAEIFIQRLQLRELRDEEVSTLRLDENPIPKSLPGWVPIENRGRNLFYAWREFHWEKDEKVVMAAAAMIDPGGPCAVSIAVIGSKGRKGEGMKLSLFAKVEDLESWFLEMGAKAARAMDALA